MTHPDELSLLRMLDRDLEHGRVAELEAHLAACPSCRRLYTRLENETQGLRVALLEEEEAIPATLRPLRGEELSWVMWSVLLLAGTGLYVLWSRFLVPWWHRLDSVGIDRETILVFALARGARWEGWSTMGETIMSVSTALVAALAAVLLVRMTWRRFHGGLALLGVMVPLVISSPARAAVIETDKEDYVLPAGGVVSNDLIVTARSIVIDGTVEGDLIALCQTATLVGPIRGDVLILAQRIFIESEVGGDVRTASEFLEIRGEIGHNVTAAAERIRLHPGSVVHGGIILAAESAVLDGRVGRDLLSATETLELNGTIDGGGRVAAAELHIGENARIGSKVTYYGHRPADVAPGAQLAEPLEFRRIEADEESVLGTAVIRFLRWAAAFVFGVVVLLALPRWASEAIRRARSAGFSMLAGLAVLVVAPIAGVLLCVTLVGLPLGLALFAAYGLAIYGGQVFVGAWLGHEILGEPQGWAATFGRLALGLGLLHLTGLIPYVGTLVSIVVALWGLGVIALVTFERTGRRAPMA